MKAVIYARYSSDSQREESIEGQLRECTEYAERNGITILRSYIDRALSARTADRPEFQNMIKDSEQKLFDVVLTNKMFYVPMVFMLAATLCSLLITVKNKIVMIGAGQALWGDWFQLIFAAAMAILALFLVAEGIQTFKKQKLSKASA